MNENTNPVNPGTNDAGATGAGDPGNASPGGDTGQQKPANDVEQTPDTAIRDAHVQTARDAHAGGQPLNEAADWLALQGHKGLNTRELAASAILAH